MWHVHLSDKACGLQENWQARYVTDQAVAKQQLIALAEQLAACSSSNHDTAPAVEVVEHGTGALQSPALAAAKTQVSMQRVWHVNPSLHVSCLHIEYG